MRDTPDEIAVKPALVAALQHMESSFLLLSAGRYPHALTACAAAIECVLREKFVNPGIAKRDQPDFFELINIANKKIKNSADLQKQAVHKLREKRNTFLHQGFSPKDDNRAAKLLLKIGFIYLVECFRKFYSFELRSNNSHPGGLDLEVDKQLSLALRVYRRTYTDEGRDFTYCFIPLAQYIRIYIQERSMPRWQQQLINKARETIIDVVDLEEGLAQEIQAEFNATWEFDCTVCQEEESFICELNQDALSHTEILLERAVCTHCSLSVPEDSPFLSEELCAQQLESIRPVILRQFGYNP